MLFDEVFPKWGPILPCFFSTGEKKVAKPIKNGHSGYILQGWLHMISLIFFQMPIKSLGLLEKIRVDPTRTGNRKHTYIFFGLIRKGV